MRVCSKCGVAKETREFSPLQTHCKVCKAAWARIYSVANAEKIAEVKRVYRVANIERITACHRAWQKANREKVATSNRNRRALKKNASGHHTDEEIAAQRKRQKDRCFWCREVLSSSHHVDHVTPLSKGGSNGLENIVISCPTCNMKKHDKLPMEFANILL